MEIKLSKAEHDALPDALKAKFQLEGDAYVLVEEDVEGLKKSKAEILAEKKRLQEERDELAKFKAEKEAEQAKQKQADLEAKGEYEKALKEKEKAWKERDEVKEARIAKIIGNLHQEHLKAELTKRGVLPDRVSYLAGELLTQTEFSEGDEGFSLKKKGGIGDAAEFESMIEAAKQRTPFFFEAKTQPGGGASGSGNNAGNGKTMPESQFDTMSPQDQAAFVKSGGTVT